MNCKDILLQMEDFHSGEMDEKTASKVRAHLRLCRECSRALEALCTEDKLYGAYSEALEQGLEVPPQMWQSIQRYIAASASKSRWRAAADSLIGFLVGLLPRSDLLRQTVFATVIVVFSVGATLLSVHLYRIREAGLEDRQTAGTRDAGDSRNSLETAVRSIQRAERDYNDAIAVLSKIVDRRKPSMDPRFVVEIERNLKTIDESIAATRAAYHAHPSDPELAQYMLTAYEKKVDLLLELAS